MVTMMSINCAVPKVLPPPGVVVALTCTSPNGDRVPLPVEFWKTFTRVFDWVNGTLVIARLIVCPFRTAFPVTLRL